MGDRMGVGAIGDRTAAGLAALALSGSLAVSCSPPAAPGAIRVPGDVPTLGAAVARAHRGDTILIAAGAYAGGIVIPARARGITIRGETRNGVVIDGRGRQREGITVRADHVTVENLTLRSFGGNALVWDRVDGFVA